MKFFIEILIALIAIEHLLILWLEMFAWETAGKKVFKGALPKELFAPTRVLAANQGLYNGFLAAGLIWSFFIENLEWKNNIALFFLICISIAGIYGSLKASKKIFWILAFPALIGVLAILLS